MVESLDNGDVLYREEVKGNFKKKPHLQVVTYNPVGLACLEPKALAKARALKPRSRNPPERNFLSY